MSKLQHYLLLLINFIQAFSVTVKLQCLGQSASLVSWWWGYKYPGNVSSSNPEYGYFDSTSTKGQVESYSGYIDSTSHPLYNTIEAINAISLKSISILLYNDQPPNQEYAPIGAHAKGIVAWDDNAEVGVWIMHSCPEYPTINEYGYIEPTLASNCDEYGQNFFCMNLDSDSYKVVVSAFKVEDPVIYFNSGSFLSNYSSTKNSEVSSMVLDNAYGITLLTKNPNYEQFLFEGIMEPYFKANMKVESWGRPYQNSECPPLIQYESLNVEWVELANGEKWNHYWDHSKWAVVYSDTVKYGCTCDMNRMESQIARGGTCICFTNNTIFYEALNGIISNVEKCNDHLSIVDI